MPRFCARFLPAVVVASMVAARAGAQAPLRYSVDLGDVKRHRFAVTLVVDSLPATATIFHFASTAPGTYQVMDVGRFVAGFSAADEAGRSLATEHIATNEWRIAEPRRVREIHYTVMATRDTTVSAHTIYPMCGTRLVSDYALINGQAVFGFPAGMQSVPISVRLHYAGDWLAETALVERGGAYVAESYDQLVDSPILVGHLTTASIDVTGVPVRIAVHSASGRVSAGQLRDAMRSMLLAAGAFIGKLPVDRYIFLFDFGDRGSGAWEHSYSSEYVLRDGPYTPELGALATDDAAHEFFHVVTPLNVHSEIIERFNFETPVPSRHLWLYEGTTEWAAQKMQLESGLKPLPEYLAMLAGKIRDDRTEYDTTVSLVQLALTSYTDAGQRQYPNIYMRGAIVAGLLDIRLLELSGGSRGLREVIRDLATRYGKRRAFPEDSLFAIITGMTAPGIGDFFARYVQRAEPLPIREYYAKLGITTIEDRHGTPVRFEIDPNATPAQLALRAAWMGKTPAR